MPRSELTSAIREMICELHAIGWGYKRIHQRYPYISLSTIRYTIKKEPERRAGYVLVVRRSFSEAETDRILEVIHGNPRVQQEDLLAEVDHKVKIRSIQRLLNSENLRKWRCSWRPLLTEEHAMKRLRWAYRYRHFTPEDWARVYWSDECTVERGIGVRREWTFTRPQNQPKEGQMFWAAFSGAERRTGLIPLFGDPNSERGGVNRFVIEELYRRILPTLISNEDGIFQQDNAPTHTAHVVRDALRDMCIEVMDWPPHSPDLNPIENLWALLKAKIYELRPDLIHMRNNDETKEILVDTAQQAWNALE
ncbi:hypothetical protein N7490_006736, partial [Penicillium lividum]